LDLKGRGEEFATELGDVVVSATAAGAVAAGAASRSW
jgi:hypothetical protein